MSRPHRKRAEESNEQEKLVRAVKELVWVTNNYYRASSAHIGADYYPLMSGSFFDASRNEVMFGQWAYHQRESDVLIPIFEHAGLPIIKNGEGWGVRSENLRIDRIEQAGRLVMAKVGEIQAQGRDATIRERAAAVARVFDAHAEELQLSATERERFLGYVLESSRTLPKKGVRRSPESGSGWTQSF